MNDNKNKFYIPSLAAFWLTFAFFIIVVAGIYINTIIYTRFISILILIATLSIFGVLLIIFSKKAKIKKIAKSFFILTGASAAGMGLSFLLHNFFYGIFIKIFGENFWGNGGDEPVFFILATIVFPLALIVGVIGSIVIIAKKMVKI